MTDATHARGCHEEARPSQVMDGYRYCPGCRRMIRATTRKEEQ